MHHTFLRLLTVCLGLHAVTGAPGTKEVEVVKAPSPYALRGNLKMPGDGDQFVNQGGAMGDIQIIYNVGPASNRSNRADLTAPPFGLAIDVILVPRREKGWNPGPHEVVLARGLRSLDGEVNPHIQSNFVPPISTCGDYRMEIHENQIYGNSVVKMLSGAPGVSVACSPLDYY